MIINVMIPNEGSIDFVTVMSWYFKEGDTIKEGDLLCEIETGKTVYYYESPVNGRLAKILYGDGEEAPATEPIAYIEVLSD